MIGSALAHEADRLRRLHRAGWCQQSAFMGVTGRGARRRRREGRQAGEQQTGSQDEAVSGGMDAEILGSQLGQTGGMKVKTYGSL